MAMANTTARNGSPPAAADCLNLVLLIVNSFLELFPEIEKQRLVVMCFEKTWAHDEGELLV
jgi:hypothetical protein